MLRRAHQLGAELSPPDSSLTGDCTDFCCSDCVSTTRGRSPSPPFPPSTPNSFSRPPDGRSHSRLADRWQHSRVCSSCHHLSAQCKGEQCIYLAAFTTSLNCIVLEPFIYYTSAVCTMQTPAVTWHLCAVTLFSLSLEISCVYS